MFAHFLLLLSLFHTQNPYSDNTANQKHFHLHAVDCALKWHLFILWSEMCCARTTVELECAVTICEPNEQGGNWVRCSTTTTTTSTFCVSDRAFWMWSTSANSIPMKILIAGFFCFAFPHLLCVIITAFRKCSPFYTFAKALLHKLFCFCCCCYA